MIKRTKGITLIEFMIVVAICAILAAMAIPNFRKARSGSSRPNLPYAYRVGGAFDSQQFDEFINHKLMPDSTSITYEGIFSHHYFELNPKAASRRGLVVPAYSCAVSRDPLTGNNEHYLAVSLLPGENADETPRKLLNLVVVMDVSGSMNEVFGNKDGEKTLIDSARSSMNCLTEKLLPDDNLAIVIFNHQSKVIQPLTAIRKTNLESLRDKIGSIRADGSTDMSLGMYTAISILENNIGIDPMEYENRVIFVTDALPNTGATDSSSLTGIARKAADSGIFFTFIGLGIDFSTKLVDEIGNVKGANYCFINSSNDFRKRLSEDFEYMLSPMAYDLNLRMSAEGYEIEKVIGVPESQYQAGSLIKINTLFPTRVEESGAKGGIILVRLKQLNSKAKIAFHLSYKNRRGEIFSSNSEVHFETAPDVYEDSAIRKAVILSRYVDVMRAWIDNDWDQAAADSAFQSGQYSQLRQEMSISPDSRRMLNAFNQYLRSEAEHFTPEEFKLESYVISRILNESKSLSERCNQIVRR